MGYLFFYVFSFKVQLFLNQSIFFLLNCEGPEFTHLVPVKAALMALTHGVYTVFMVNAAKKTVYNAMSAAFTRTE